MFHIPYLFCGFAWPDYLTLKQGETFNPSL